MKRSFFIDESSNKHKICDGRKGAVKKCLKLAGCMLGRGAVLNLSEDPLLYLTVARIFLSLACPAMGLKVGPLVDFRYFLTALLCSSSEVEK